MEVADGKTYTGAATVAHEGQHGVDRANGVNPGRSFGRIVDFEQKGSQTSYDTQKALGDPPDDERYFVQKGAIDSAKSYCLNNGPCGD